MCVCVCVNHIGCQGQYNVSGLIVRQRIESIKSKSINKKNVIVTELIIGESKSK